MAQQIPALGVEIDALDGLRRPPRGRLSKLRKSQRGLEGLEINEKLQLALRVLALAFRPHELKTGTRARHVC